MSAPQGYGSLVEQLKAWERQLGPEKVREAIALVRGWGWPDGSAPPPFVWAEAYSRVSLPVPLKTVDAHAPEAI